MRLAPLPLFTHDELDALYEAVEGRMSTITFDNAIEVDWLKPDRMRQWRLLNSLRTAIGEARSSIAPRTNQHQP